MIRQFDHERLEVYQQELLFIAWVTSLLQNIKANGPRSRWTEVADQLGRASLSALLNTAEANGKRQRQGRAKYFDDARGSATECTACLDALVAKGLCSAIEVQSGKEILVRVVSMLTKLVQHFDGNDSGRTQKTETASFPSSSFSSSPSSSNFAAKEGQ